MFTSANRKASRALAVLLAALLAVVAAPLSISNASAQDELPTIAEVAVATPELSTLVTALDLASNAGPTDFLAVASDPSADLTVFAPTNLAFATLGQETLDRVLADPGGLLTTILSYHVLGTSENAHELLDLGQATTLLGENVTITQLDDGRVFINGAQVVIADVQASNGVVHVIDAVLTPVTAPPPPPEPQTIAQIAVATPELSTLVAALTLASAEGPTNFLAVASDPNADLTVFAPTNDAFAALGQETLDAVLADPAGLLTNILAYHVLGTSEAAADLIAAGQATTLQGDTVAITIDPDGNVLINNSKVVIADIEASNGIVHVIDAVLLPPAPPEETPVFNGARVYVTTAFNGRFLDGDRRYWRSNVDTSSYPRLDDEWILEDTGNGTWRLLNAKLHRYLDADNRYRRYNVDLARQHAFGTEWEIILLDNGNYQLRSVAFNRYLDYDRHNVDTARNPNRIDREWQIELVADH